jgi:hypothetical protein
MARYVFHYCCRTCFSQEVFDKYRCAKCRYFDSDRQLQSLYLSEKEMESMEAESARREIKGLSFNKEEREAYLQLIKKETMQKMRNSRLEREALQRQARELAAEETSWRKSAIGVEKERIVEYSRQEGPGRDNIFKYLFRLIAGY